MRISDWSSDVCSSDLVLQRQISHAFLEITGLAAQVLHLFGRGSASGISRQAALARYPSGGGRLAEVGGRLEVALVHAPVLAPKTGRESCRESAGQTV